MRTPNYKAVVGCVAVLFVLVGSTLVQAQVRSNTPTVAAVEPNATTTLTDGKMKIKLRKGLELKGTPIDLETIKMDTLFGEAAIPVHAIAGIRFAQKGGEQSTVVLQNGDALTGQLAISQLKFVSDWGEATVNVSELFSLVFRTDLAWTSISTPTGQRWRLTRSTGGTSSATRSFRSGR